MITELGRDYSLRGYAFEFIAKVLLRRQKANNFIFATNQFDSIDEILLKYHLEPIGRLAPLLELLREEWKRCDLLEFVTDDRRVVHDIISYEVKTKFHRTDRKYFEMCLSNHKYFRRIEQLGCTGNIVSIILFDNWKFSCNIIPYKRCRIRVYSRHQSSKQEKS